MAQCPAHLLWQDGAKEAHHIWVPQSGKPCCLLQHVLHSSLGGCFRSTRQKARRPEDM